jgi:predicted nucleotidyltransferase component of viral defense system
MLDPNDLARVSSTFGVAELQVRRDHLIGHMLSALSRLDIPSLVFFGGTALSWTHLIDGRLSEDIDLYVGDRRRAAETIEAAILRSLRHEFPGAGWQPGLTAVTGITPARLVTPEEHVVRVQLLDVERQGWPPIPTEQRQLVRRYRDIPAISLRVPTLAGFAAMKALAWTDRRAARDLFDLAGLARVGALTEDAAELFHRATGRSLATHDFDGREPTDWDAALRHQTRELPKASDCLGTIRSAMGWIRHRP